MTISIARVLDLEINALGGSRAMHLALDKAGDLLFLDRSPQWDDDDLPVIKDFSAFEETKAAGYAVKLVRRGYAHSENSGEFDADYAILECSGPLAPFANPNIIDPDPAYRAAIEQDHLNAVTSQAQSRLTKPRI